MSMSRFEYYFPKQAHNFKNTVNLAARRYGLCIRHPAERRTSNTVYCTTLR
jgi:hypothetical protein